MILILYIAIGVAVGLAITPFIVPLFLTFLGGSTIVLSKFYNISVSLLKKIWRTLFYTFLTIVILVSLLFVIDSKLAKDERTARQEAIKKEETSRGARPSLESIFWPQHNKQSLEAILGTNKIEKGGPISRFFSKLLN